MKQFSRPDPLASSISVPPAITLKLERILGATEVPMKEGTTVFESCMEAAARGYEAHSFATRMRLHQQSLDDNLDSVIQRVIPFLRPMAEFVQRENGAVIIQTSAQAVLLDSLRPGMSATSQIQRIKAFADTPKGLADLLTKVHDLDVIRFPAGVENFPPTAKSSYVEAAQALRTEKLRSASSGPEGASDDDEGTQFRDFVSKTGAALPRDTAQQDEIIARAIGVVWNDVKGDKPVFLLRQEAELITTVALHTPKYPGSPEKMAKR